MNKFLVFAASVLLLASCVAKVEEDNAADALQAPRITSFYREMEELTRELNQIRERNCLPKWKDAPKEVRSLVTLI